MPVTNDQIYKKLESIEKSIDALKAEEKEVLKEESHIVMEESKLLGLLNNKVELQFENIIEWKSYVWDSCEYKKSAEKNNKIDFICKKTGNKCRFLDCFRNRK